MSLSILKKGMADKSAAIQANAGRHNVAAAIVEFVTGKQPHSVKVRRLDTNEEITVSLTDAPAVKPGGKPRPEIACFAGVDRIDGQARTPNLKVGAGAVVQFENLKKAGNEYKASWMTLMSKNPAEAPVFVNVATTVREYKSGGDVNRYALFAHLPAATKVTSLDELKAVIAQSMSKSRTSGFAPGEGGVIIRAAEGGERIAMAEWRGGAMADGKFVENDPIARANEIVSSETGAGVQQAIEGGAIVEVIPAARISVNSQYIVEGGKLNVEDFGLRADPTNSDDRSLRRTRGGKLITGFTSCNIGATLKDGQIFVNRVFPSTYPQAVPMNGLNTKNIQVHYLDAVEKTPEHEGDDNHGPAIPAADIEKALAGADDLEP